MGHDIVFNITDDFWRSQEASFLDTTSVAITTTTVQWYF